MKLTKKHMKHLAQFRTDINYTCDVDDMDAFHCCRSELIGYLNALEDSELITREETIELFRYYSSDNRGQL